MSLTQTRKPLPLYVPRTQPSTQPTNDDLEELSDTMTQVLRLSQRLVIEAQQFTFHEDPKQYRSFSSLSTQEIGRIGIDYPPNEFTDVHHLKDLLPEIPIFDLIAEKDGEIYVFAACARKRYGANGQINPAYNILTGAYSKRYKEALDGLTHLGHDIDKIHYCFLICPVEENQECVYYWGEFTDVRPACTRENLLRGAVTYFAVSAQLHHLNSYRRFGSWNWDYIKRNYLKLSM